MSHWYMAPGPGGVCMDIPGHHWCGCEGMAWAAPLPMLRLAAARPTDVSAAESIRVIRMIVRLFLHAPPRCRRHPVKYTAAECLPIPRDHGRGSYAPISHKYGLDRRGGRVLRSWRRLR